MPNIERLKSQELATFDIFVFLLFLFPQKGKCPPVLLSASRVNLECSFFKKNGEEMSLETACGFVLFGLCIGSSF